MYHPQSLSLSIIVPAFNEENNIEVSLQEFLEATRVLSSQFEIIVVNDGSSDSTSQRVRQWMEKYPQIRLIEHEVNQGIGAAYRTGLNAARMNYCMLLCADNTIGSDSLKEIFLKMGQADLVLPFIGNPESRNWRRRSISFLYVTSLNAAFGYRLKYYNGLHILPTQALRQMDITPSFAFSAQIVVRLLKAGYSYVDVPMINRERTEGSTKAFRPKNVFLVVKTILSLTFEVYFKPNAVQKVMIEDSSQFK